MATRVLVMRHGQSEGNVARIWTSARTGYPLTDLGREQARTAAEPLRDAGIEAAYHSPLVRARQTAQEAAAVLGVETHDLPGVEELHVGVLEEKHDDEVAPIAIDVFGRWLHLGDLDHGFEGGETGRQVADRVAAALAAVADSHDGGTALVVSHGGAMALGLTAMSANLTPRFAADHLLENAEVVDLVRDDDGTWRCVSWAGLAPG
jgi:probable phosphoglycerate mutase